ncbi:hypothetical protein OIU74_013486 [Salix koriyanagi]|uniref:Uncharacterized protein n=1 Tax=Salix koriyanagi TaxID=2511006 RepID=A0A9Q0Q980_9ROSI|nr:hypothetical protein OIU74_013486 [Salix koriyanagi]
MSVLLKKKRDVQEEVFRLSLQMGLPGPDRSGFAKLDGFFVSTKSRTCPGFESLGS